MARQIRKPQPRERERRTQERIRKKEIEDAPSGGGSVTSAFVWSATGNAGTNDYRAIGSTRQFYWDYSGGTFNESGGWSMADYTANALTPGTGSDHLIIPPSVGDYEISVAGYFNYNNLTAWQFLHMSVFLEDGAYECGPGIVLAKPSSSAGSVSSVGFSIATGYTVTNPADGILLTSVLSDGEYGVNAQPTSFHLTDMRIAIRQIA